MACKLKFNNSTKSQFFAETRSRVDDYFTGQKLSRHANSGMWTKTIIFMTLFLGLYGLLLSGFFAGPVLLIFCVLLGMVSAFVGFNICHDAIHGSYSSNKTTNEIFSLIFHLVGANPYVWNITHNVVHHTYTNIPGHDEDIDVAPGLIRVSTEQPLNRLHRFQHWYAFPLYSLASISWVFRKDYKKFFQAKVGETVNKHPRKEYFNLFFYKLLYLFLFIALPIFVLDAAWWQILLGFLLMHFAQGLTMGLVFQLAHVVEGTEFPTPDATGNMEEAWAEHQMRTTANFAGDCPVAAFFLGGLNRQIEHHLFPKVCHIHYGKIGAIVKQTALEFNIPYIENRTFGDAMRSHLRMLKRFGTA